MLFCYYFSPLTPGAASFTVDVTPNIRLGAIQGLSGEARLGATGVSTQVFDDPTSTIGHSSDGIVGLKSMYFNETACPAGNQRLWTGYIGPRTYRRGQGNSLITGVEREVEVSLIDVNDFLSFRVFAPVDVDPTSSFVRSAETDLERVQGLLNDVDFLSTTLFDVGYIPATGGVDMDANDYTGMSPADVLNDCAQASGRNFWVKYHEATNQLVLWYDDWKTDGTATLAYDSALRLTNVLSEVDGTTTFAADMDASETLDPSRVVSATYLQGTGVTTYATLPQTANTFAWRDSVMPSVFVKSQAKLDALADRYLADNSTEDSKISCTVQLPAAYVTGIHEGMRLEVHFTHLPSVASGFTWTRVLSRTIRVDVETQAYYWLDLELSPIPPAVPVYMLLMRAEAADIISGGVNESLGFASTGDAPPNPPGGTPIPTVGPLVPISGLVSWAGTTPVTGVVGVRFLGSGTINYRTTEDLNPPAPPGPFQALTAANGVTATIDMLINGSVVDSVSAVTAGAGGASIVFNGSMSVAYGDELTFRFRHDSGTFILYVFDHDFEISGTLA